jgi:NAD(P)-dependent dehydrogenase (short-subunit alcohol dehydrogenase family)
MARTVAVTGGSGKLGRAVVAALIDEGWTVINFDRVPSSDSRARFIRTDLTDYGQVVEAISGIDEVHRGVDAVVHLAAIPGATFAPNVATFDNNLVSTFHVFQAAKLFKINNLVWRPARPCSATRSTTRPRTCRSTRTCRPHRRSSTPSQRSRGGDGARASTAAGTQIRR